MGFRNCFFFTSSNGWLWCDTIVADLFRIPIYTVFPKPFSVSDALGFAVVFFYLFFFLPRPFSMSSSRKERNVYLIILRGYIYRIYIYGNCGVTRRPVVRLRELSLYTTPVLSLLGWVTVPAPRWSVTESCPGNDSQYQENSLELTSE